MDEESEPKPSFVRRLSKRFSKRRKREEAPKFEEITRPAGYEHEDLHTLMKRLKQEVTQLKVLHKEWEKPSKRPKLEHEFKEFADHVYTYASMIAKRVGIPTVQKEIIEEHEREIVNLRGELRDLKNSRDNDKRLRDRESEIFRLKREIQTLNGELQNKRQSESDQTTEGENRRYSRGRLARKEDNSAPDTSKYIIHDLKERIEKMKQESEEMQQNLNVVKGENDDLKQQLQSVKDDNHELAKRGGEYSRQLVSLRDKLQVLENKNHQLQDSDDDSIDKIREETENNSEQKSRHSSGSHKTNKSEDGENMYREDLEKVTKHSRELSLTIRKNEENIQKLQRMLKEERDAKNEALNRLNEKPPVIVHNVNPNIQDLSDSYRPTKLAEKISELYDNEWTNAMENLEHIGMSEKDSLTLLLNILVGVYQKCQSIAEKQMCVIARCFTEPPITDSLVANDIKQVQNLPQDIQKTLLNYRKEITKLPIPFLKQELKKELLKGTFTEEQSEACEEYTDKCVQYCWAMNIHRPPVHIAWEFPEGSQFNSALFRSYTKCGKLVDFVVWPVLYLYKDGPLLGKGVAQGKSIDSAV